MPSPAILHGREEMRVNFISLDLLLIPNICKASEYRLSNLQKIISALEGWDKWSTNNFALP
jgi:hypothetical protein